jgi:hypothetical protein
MKKLILGVAIAALFLSACTQNKSTGTASLADSATIKNKSTAIAAIEAFNNHDVDAIYKDCAANFKDFGNGSMPPVSNMDTLKANMKGFLEALPDFKGENIQAVAAGDTVIVTADWSGTFKKDYMGMKATNKSFKAPDADVFIFNKEGKMISHRSIQGEPTYFYQLGIPMQ